MEPTTRSSKRPKQPSSLKRKNRQVRPKGGPGDLGPTSAEDPNPTAEDRRLALASAVTREIDDLFGKPVPDPDEGPRFRRYVAELEARRLLLEQNTPLADALGGNLPHGFRRFNFSLLQTVAFQRVFERTMLAAWSHDDPAVRVQARKAIEDVGKRIVALAGPFPGRPAPTGAEQERAARAAIEYLGNKGSRASPPRVSARSRRKAIAKKYKISRNLLDEAIEHGRSLREKRHERGKPLQPGDILVQLTAPSRDQIQGLNDHLKKSGNP